MIIARKIEKSAIEWLNKGKIVAIYGPRQVGKTTLAKDIVGKSEGLNAIFDCENRDVRDVLESHSLTAIERLVGKAKTVLFDEAQKTLNIGTALKILHDAHPEIRIIATGSSSFDLANKISEPLTGRMIYFFLYPLSFGEIEEQFGYARAAASVEQVLRFGAYPEIFLSDDKGAEKLLGSISDNYLYRDIFQFESLRKPELLIKLLRLLALQLGSEVSLHELSLKLECSRQLVSRYIELLEQVFVIFRLPPFSRNLRNEIGRKQKIYFYDLGIRNSLISQFNAPHTRSDIGGLWENYLIAERKKMLSYIGQEANLYFWRDTSGGEVDLVEEYEGKISGYECKWGDGKNVRPPKKFQETYQASWQVVDRTNFTEFVVGKTFL